MMFENNIKTILYQTWPTLLIVSVIYISMRLVYIIKNKTKVKLYKEILMYLFIAYIMCLFYVVTFQDVSWSTSNYIPFKEIFRYTFGSRNFMKNVLGNMIMFIPYGFFASYFLKLDKVYSISILTLLTSLTIELTQAKIGRVFDVDDILLNYCGSMIGFVGYRIISKIESKLPNLLKNQIIYNIIIIVIVLLMVLYITSL